MSKADRRARKKANKAKKPKPPPAAICDDCGFAMPANKEDYGSIHDTPYSSSRVTSTGEVFVAWCPYCGCEYAH